MMREHASESKIRSELPQRPRRLLERLKLSRRPSLRFDDKRNLEEASAWSKSNSGVNILFYLCTHGHDRLVTYVLLSSEKPAEDANSKDDLGRRPLHVAAAHGHISICESLLDRGAKVNALDLRKRTAVLEAASLGHASVVELLHRRGADVDMADENLIYPLLSAVLADHYEVVRVLLKCEALLLPQPRNKDRDSGDQLLQLLDSSVSKAIITDLIDYGALRFRDDLGNTALHRAARRGDTPKLHWLLELGADPDILDKKGNSPLYTVIRQSHGSPAAEIQALLQSGANAKFRDNKGNTLLHALTFVWLFSTQSKSCEPSIALLLRYGTEIEALNGVGATALQIVMQSPAPETRRRQIIGELLQHGASFSTKLKNGKSVFHKAVDNFIGALDSPLGKAFATNDRDTLIWLMQAPIDLPIKGGEGTEPLLKFLEAREWELAELALRRGAYPGGASERGCRPLHLAAKNGGPLFKRILDYGIDLDIADGDGETVLSAAARGYITHCSKTTQSFVAILNRVNVDRLDTRGRSILHFILEQQPNERSVELVRILLTKYNANSALKTKSGKSCLQIFDDAMWNIWDPKSVKGAQPDSTVQKAILQTLQLLVSSGIKLSETPQNGAAFAVRAVYSEYTPLTDYLSSLGAPRFVVMSNGTLMTRVNKAASLARPTMLRHFLDVCGDPVIETRDPPLQSGEHKRGTGSSSLVWWTSPLLDAIRANRPENVELLLARGVPADESSSSSPSVNNSSHAFDTNDDATSSPLQLAAQRGNAHIMRLLFVRAQTDKAATSSVSRNASCSCCLARGPSNNTLLHFYLRQTRTVPDLDLVKMLVNGAFATPAAAPHGTITTQGDLPSRGSGSNNNNLHSLNTKNSLGQTPLDALAAAVNETRSMINRDNTSNNNTSSGTSTATNNNDAIDAEEDNTTPPPADLTASMSGSKSREEIVEYLLGLGAVASSASMDVLKGKSSS